MVVMKEKLEELIPEGNLAVYHHFRKMLLDFGANESLSLGFKIAEEIKERLDILKNRGFIEEREANFTFDNLMAALCLNDKTGKLIANKGFLRKRGNQRDWNLTLFIYLTVSDLKVYTDMPHYGAVADHLTNLQIYGRNSLPFTAKAVESIFKRITRKEVTFLLDMLHAVHYGNNLLPLELMVDCSKINKWDRRKKKVKELESSLAAFHKNELIPWELIKMYDERGFLGPGCRFVGLSSTIHCNNPFR